MLFVCKFCDVNAYTLHLGHLRSIYAFLIISSFSHSSPLFFCFYVSIMCWFNRWEVHCFAPPATLPLQSSQQVFFLPFRRTKRQTSQTWSPKQRCFWLRIMRTSAAPRYKVPPGCSWMLDRKTGVLRDFVFKGQIATTKREVIYLFDTNGCHVVKLLIASRLGLQVGLFDMSSGFLSRGGTPKSYKLLDHFSIF